MAGRPRTSTHPRAERWREYARRKYEEKKRQQLEFNVKPLARVIQNWSKQ